MKFTKKHQVILVLLAALSINAHAQEVVATSGGFGTTASAKVTFTIGETITETITSTGVALTQGFNQGELVITIVRDSEINGLNLKVFPNPTTDIVNITSDTEGIDNLRFVVIDLFGRKLRDEKLVLPMTQFTVSELKSGIYLLKVLAGNKEIGIYRIIKK